MKALAFLLLLLAAPARAQERLLDLSKMNYAVERVGTFTYLHCADRQAPGCALFEKLQLQPDTDWDSLIAAARKPRRRSLRGPLPVLAKTRVVDQHGGMWIVALLPPRNGRSAGFLGELTYVVVPEFPGYRITLNDRGAVASADVVVDKAEWRRDLAAQPKPKKGLARLFE